MYILHWFSNVLVTVHLHDKSLQCTVYSLQQEPCTIPISLAAIGGPEIIYFANMGNPNCEPLYFDCGWLVTGTLLVSTMQMG